MKRKIFLVCLLVIAILTTSMVPLCVFAQDQVFSISGYVEVREMGGSIFPQATIGIPENPKLPDGFVKGLKKGIKVTVDATDFSAVTDADGYFEIKNIPAKETGYVLKFKGAGVEDAQIVINSFTKDVVYEKSSPLTLQFSWDLNGDGVINMTDLMVIAKDFNKVTSTYKISGYVKFVPKYYTRPGEFTEVLPGEIIDMLKNKVNVTVEGTDFSAVTDADGYFEIKNIPAKETGYVLKLSKATIKGQVVIDSFTKDIVYEKSSPIMVEFNADLDNNGIVNMQDIMVLAAYVNQKTDTYKISGYIGVEIMPLTFNGESINLEDFSEHEKMEQQIYGYKQGVKVTIEGTDLSATSDADGYFEINNVPAKATGYTLKFTSKFLSEKQVVIDLFTKDVVYEKSSPVTLKFTWDLDGNGVVNMQDMMKMAAFFNQKIDTYKISGYVAHDFESKDSSVKSLFKVEIDESISTFTDKNGYFEFEAIPGNKTGYTLKISKANYLYREVKIDALTSDIEVSSKEKPIIMNIGDINGDNAVNLNDIMLMSSAFNLKAGDDGYNEKYDLNMDGAINLVDILIAAKSFNKTAKGL